MLDNNGLRTLNNKLNLKVVCSTCRLRGVCLPSFLDIEHLEQSDSVISKRTVASRKDQLFCVDDAFSSLYVIQSGSVMTYTITAQGDVQIMGFFLPGEVFGFDGIAKGKHHLCARAMETSSICTIPYSAVKESQPMQRYIIHVFSKELELEEERIYMLAQQSAAVRVASFFLNLSARYARCKLSATHFHLPMARNEIANYLGLSIETVSRILNRFKTQKLLKVADKDIEILDIDKLANFCAQGNYRCNPNETCQVASGYFR